MKDIIKYLSAIAICTSNLACSKKDEPANTFGETVWVAKVDMNTAADKRIHGYRLTFLKGNRYRITSLDEKHYVWNVASTGTYRYEHPYLTLTEDRGGSKVFTYRTSPEEHIYAEYYGVDFFQQ